MESGCARQSGLAALFWPAMRPFCFSCFLLAGGWITAIKQTKANFKENRPGSHSG